MMSYFILYEQLAYNKSWITEESVITTSSGQTMHKEHQNQKLNQTKIKKENAEQSGDVADFVVQLTRHSSKKTFTI